MRRLCGIFYFFIRCIGLSVYNILAHRGAFKPSILQNHAEMAAQGISFYFSYIRAVYAYTSSADIVKSHQKIDKRCFSAACGADDGNPLSALCRKRYIFKKRLFGRIWKWHVFKFNLAAVGFLCAVRRFLRLVQKLENAQKRCFRVLQLCQNRAYLVKRLCILPGIA